MPILQDLIFGDYLARKRREHNAALLDSQRPDVEFKAGVDRATEVARLRAATEEADRLAGMRRKRERNKLSEDTADEIGVASRYGSDPLYPSTTAGADAARRRELATGSNAKSEYNIGYTPFANDIGALEGSRKRLETTNERSKLAGRYGLSYRIGETEADAEAARNEALAAVARGTSKLTPGRVALEEVQNSEATSTAPGAGKLERSKNAAANYKADLEAMVNASALEDGQTTVDTAKKLRDLDSILAGSNLRTANRLFDPETGSPIDAAIQFGGGRLPQGAAIPGVNYPSPSEDIKMVKDPLTGIEKPMAVREAGKPVPTLGRRLIVPGTNPDRPPIGVGKLPDDGNQPPPPAIDSSPKVVKKSADLSNISLEDWKNFAYKSYKIKPDKGVFVDKDPIPTLLRLMDKELSTGVDAVTGQPLAPETVQEISNQRKAILKLVSR